MLARVSEHLLEACRVAASDAQRVLAPAFLVRVVCLVDAVVVGDAPRALQMEFPALGGPLAEAQSAVCGVQAPFDAVGWSREGGRGEAREDAAVDDGEA